MNFLHKIPLFFFSLLYPCKIYGKDNLPSGGAIFVCNHFRAIDCGFVSLAYNKDIKFLAKAELFKNKIIGGLIKSFGAIPIDRENPDMKSMLACIRHLKDGHKLCIFPEGTRNKSKTTELQDIKGGTAVFAVKSKCPIVPMMLSGKGKLLKRTKLIIGKPFELDEFYGRKLTDADISQMDDIVRDKMLEQQAELLKISKKSRKGKRKKSNDSV